MKMKIKLGVGSLEGSLRRFADAWREAEHQDRIDNRHMLSFEDMATFLKVITPGRWVLLRVLRSEGAMSVRALATLLQRDYKNVHRDISILEKAGLLERTKEKRLKVPWDTLVAEVDLKAA
jgi:predicted transcriptional regulator